MQGHAQSDWAGCMGGEDERTTGAGTVPDSMVAMVLDAQRQPLRRVSRPLPAPAPGQLLLKVRACAVCRTDLHVVDGDLTHPVLPLVPGHEIVAEVVNRGEDLHGFTAGERVGVPWLGWTCGECMYCTTGRENLCDRARFTGYDLDGGYAEYTVADHRYCLRLPNGIADEQAAPLLCAGLIGYRSLRMAGDGAHIGFYGFGAAAHILTQLAVYEGRRVYAFTRPGDTAGQEFARSMGAHWAGDSDRAPPRLLDAAIIFAPAGPLVPAALRAVAKGGTVVCGGIHMSDIPSFPYEILWGERVVRSVANLTRSDGIEFMKLAGQAGVRTEVRAYPLIEANAALDDLRAGRVHGAAVLVPARGRS
jgi:alcohol dehydrogenase, propanol-preferring